MKLKLPSVHSLWLNFRLVVVRFPLQVLAALAATIACCYLARPVGTDKKLEEQLIVFISVCNFALTLLLAADLYTEANKFTIAKCWALRLVMILICTGLYFALNPSLYEADVYRIGLLAFAFHLLAAFAPFIGKENLNGFWQFNKSLFLRFLTSALYAAVLYAGLAIALVAIDGLFNVKIGWQIYMRLLAIVTVGFMTVFFLAGIPKDFEALDKEESYPKGLKIFTQYVLIPLMTIYLVILLVYEVKIVLHWELPKGLVSTLILGYAVFGILSLLLIYPIKEKEENGWMKLFSRFFYIMMIPLVVLLLLAVWKRVGHYGITESRYILVVLAIWLSLITIYFLASKRQNIKIIPVSLCVLALLAVYGPQSAFSVSEYSQVARLKKLMASSDKMDVLQRTAVVSYLVNLHGLKSLQPFTKVDLTKLENKIEQKAATTSRYSIKNDKTDTAYALLKIKKDSNSLSESINFLPEEGGVVNIKGYDFITPINNYNSEADLKVNGDVIVIDDKQRGNLKVKIGNGPIMEFNVSKLAEEAIARYKTGKLKEKPTTDRSFYLPSAFLTLTRDLNQYEVKLLLVSLNGATNTDDLAEPDRWLNYNGYLLIRIK